ncbi:MAG: hypothetical protein MJ147_02065 [Clostridia bacterium]|nr:hypothetical protein [Clostridia bacterium]
MKNKVLKIITSIVLVLTICVTTCTSAFAASNQQRYISDIIICSASNAEEAEKELKTNGYKLLSTEYLNKALNKGMYLGYKTTANPDEAITDISAMNMSGKYSFSDYEILMEKMKEDVGKTVEGLVPMINAYRENYKANNPLAVEAHKILNKFFEDDSAKYMGDYLLTCDLSDTTDLTKVFMQGYGPFIVDIQQLLFLAGENDSDKNWIEKMASSDPDAVIDLYVDSYATPNKAFTALAKDYGSTVEDLELTWNGLYELLLDTSDIYFKDETCVEIDTVALDEQLDLAEEKSEAKLDDKKSDEENFEVLENIAESTSIYDSIADANLASYLASLEYDDGTMLDFFMRPFEDVDETELYTLAHYMGKKLTAQLSNVGLTQIVSRALVDGKNATADKFEEINESLKEVEAFSIYDGVDRSLFENGVALTGATVEKYVSSGKDWSEDLFSRIFQPAGEYKWKDYFAFYVLPAAVSLVAYTSLLIVNKFMEQAIRKALLDGAEIVEATASKNVIQLIHNDLHDQIHATVQKHIIANLAYGKGLVARGDLTYRIVSNIRCAFFVLTIVMSVVSLVMLVVTLVSSDENPSEKYTSIPNHIVDTINTKHGDDYVAYDAVKNTQGVVADLNNYKGTKGWLVLYTTKDPAAGAPITPDFKIVKGSTKAPLDYENLNLFGQTDVTNITAKDFTGLSDSAGGTYVYFSRGDISTIGSVFSNGQLAISIGIGACLGIALGALSSKLVGKKKKKAEA